MVETYRDLMGTNDKEKTKEQLIRELQALRRKVADLEKSAAPNRQPAAALPDSEWSIRPIIDNLLSGMIYQVVRRKDGTLVFTYLSDTVRCFYGISPEEGLADANLIYGRIHEEDRARVFQEGEEAQRTLSPFRSEVRMLDPAGGIRWSLFLSHPRRLADGATCWDGIEFDITDRKKVEEALRESEEKFSKTFKTIPDAVAIARSSDGVYIDVNDSYTKVSGYAREELIGRSALPGDLDLWIRREDREPFAAALKETGEALGVEFQFRRKDGAIRNGLMSARVLDIKGETCHVAIISDITEPKRAQEELQRLHANLTATVKAIPDLLFEVDRQGRILNFFASKTNKLYVEPGVFLGKRVREILPPDAAGIIQRAIDEAARRGHHLGAEYSLALQGENRWYELSIAAKGDHRLPETKFIALARDITERKRAEEALRSSEKKLSRIFKTIPDPVSVIRLSDGMFLDVNDSFVRVSGFPREEIVGRPYYSVKPDVWIQRQDRLRVVAALREAGEVHGMEATFRGKDGKVIYGLISARLLEINGETCVLGIVRDITERRRQEEELARSEEKFRTIFENNSSATALIEPDSTFSMVNDAYCQMTGYTREEMVGMNWTRLIPPEDLDRMKEFYRRRYANSLDAPARYEFSFYHKNGQIRHGLLSPSIIPSSRQLISSAFDITELKQAEKALKKSKERLRALSAHLQSVREEERAHISREIHDDLGQLLTGLKIDLSWFLRHPHPDRQELKEKTRAMSQLIDQTVQTIRRISTELRPRILDDFGLVAALEWQAEEFAKKTGIACRFRSNGRKIDTAPEIAINVFRIFQETLTNAARHSGATKVEASLKKDVRDLVLTIRDNGQGISAEEIARSNSLGLVGMRERALIVGGTIEIRGGKGKGTAVVLRLPVAA